MRRFEAMTGRNRHTGRILRGGGIVLLLLLLFAVGGAEPAVAAGGDHGGAAGHAEGGINWFSFDYGCWGGPDAKHENPPFFFALLNFAILVFLLVRAVRTPAGEFLRARHQRIQRELDEAKRMRAEARARLDEVERRLSRLDDELEAIRRSAAEEAKRERERILAEAEAEAERIARAAERTLEADVARIRHTLEREVADAVVGAARGILEERITDADQRRLAQDYIASIGAEEAK